MDSDPRSEFDSMSTHPFEFDLAFLEIEAHYMRISTIERLRLGAATQRLHSVNTWLPAFELGFALFDEGSHAFLFVFA